MKKQRRPILLGVLVLALGFAVYQYTRPAQPGIRAIEEGQILTITGTDITIANQTQQTVWLDEEVMLHIINTDGNGQCYSFVLDDTHEPPGQAAGFVMDGTMYVTAKRGATIMNAGAIATCYVSRFGYPNLWEPQLYDADVYALAKVARYRGDSYAEFVELTGGLTYLSEEAYLMMDPAPGLPLSFVKP